MPYPARTLLALGALVLTCGAGLAVAGPPAPLGHDATMLRLLSTAQPGTASVAAAPAPVAVPKAHCGKRSHPETALQGEVPAADRTSGRNLKPYSCNLEQLNVELGEGAGLQAAYYGSCAYYGTLGHGTRALDVTDRRHPTLTASLLTPAMVDPWESLKASPGRGLLAAVEGTLDGPTFFDVYDIREDCAHPQLRASLPMNALGHEGEWSQDGKTYYGTGIAPGVMTAIDVTNPALPQIITTANLNPGGLHGLSTNRSGNRVYLTAPNLAGAQVLMVLDTSEIQQRVKGAQPKVLSTLSFPGGYIQHTIPITSHGHPYLLLPDENAYGGLHVIDIADERHPRMVTTVLTEIQLPRNRARADATETGFAYNFHYCNVDRLVDPTVVACSVRGSGARVYDLRDVSHPRELAYFNPGAVGSTDSQTTAQIHLDATRGELWFTDGTRGLIVCRFTNGVWPFRARR